MKYIFVLFIIILMIAVVGCSEDNNENIDANEPAPILGRIILATTTSTYDSGLLDFILPEFTFETGWEVDVIAVGTGAALQMGRDGQADVLLVHSRNDEDQFVADGYGTSRYDVMYNDFIIVGPSSGIIDYTNNVEDAFRQIANGTDFVSRGDDSGTHRKELEIWGLLGIQPESNPNYIEVGQGMGATIAMAREMNAFTLSDRATWLNYPDRGELIIVCEGDDRLFNPYGVIPVSGHLNENINTDGGLAFAKWITGQSGQALIAVFGLEEFGAPLFFPDS
jgi:tungstate transport system substrate-binding protein